MTIKRNDLCEINALRNFPTAMLDLANLFIKITPYGEFKSNRYDN